MTVRVSQQAYFDAALDVLAEDGFKGLSIARLVDTLGVTKGSFYHHFGSLAGFTTALLEHWGREQTLVLRDLNFGVGAPEEDIEALRKVAVGMRHEAEAALRAWAMNDPRVGEAVRRVDEGRRRNVHAAISLVVPDARRAESLTDLGMSLLVGFQLLTPTDHDLIERMLDEYAALILQRSLPA